MAFPETILPITVELDINGTWTNVSTDVYEKDEITITRGRQAENGEIVPTTCNFTLRNETGTYSPKNPRSPYYGHIGRNTPVRVSVDAGSPYLSLPGTAGDSVSTPDAAALDVTGDIDVRIDLTSSALQDADVVHELAGKYTTAGDQRSWYLTVSEGIVSFRWSTLGTAASEVSVQSTAAFHTPRGGRIALRVTLDVDNGAGGNTATFYTSDTIDGTWTKLGNTVTNSGTTSIFNSTAQLQVGTLTSLSNTSLAGRVHAFQLRNGIGGTAVADIDFAAETVGATSFTGDDGLTWTVNGGASITNRQIRFIGEVSAWPVRWTTGGFDVRVEVEAAGVLRRLGQGAAPLQSALRRSIPTSLTLLAYWPFEDEDGATRVGSALSGGPLLNGQGLDFAAASTLPGSSPLPQFASDSGATPAKFFGSVPEPTGDAVSQWEVEFVYFAEAFDANYQNYLRVATSGTVDSWTIGMSSTGFRILGQFDGAAGGVYTDTSTWAAQPTGAIPSGEWYRLRFFCQQFGASIQYTLTWLQGDATITSYTNTRGSSTVGWVTGVGAPSGGYSTAMDGVAFGHLAVFSDNQNVYNDADLGFAGETAGTRMQRLCTEEDVPFYLHGLTTEEEEVGAQSPGQFLDLLQEAADADHGILYEERDETALAFQDRVRLYNQSADMTLDYEGDDGLVTPFDPVDDDRYLRNDRTVTRKGGGSARAVLETGTLSIQPPPAGAGIYADQTTLNLHEDDQTPNHASWLLHQGTVDETRYPAITVLLQNATHMIDEALKVDIGSRIDITNPPTWLPPEDIDLMVQGYTEILHQKRWELTYHSAPAGSWNIGILESATYSRADTAGSELVSAVTSSGTSFHVTPSDGGRLWATSTDFAADFPLSLVIGGERVSATACTNALRDLFGRTETSSWGTADVGGAWTTAGGSASNFSVSGGLGLHTMTTTNVSRRSSLTSPSADFDVQVDISTSALATGGSIFGGLMARVVDLDNLYMARLEFTTSAGIVLAMRERAAGVEATLGASYTTSLTHVANTLYRLRFQGDGTALRARVWLASSVEPDLWHVDTTDSTLTAAGTIGCRSILNPSNTNVNPIVRYDNFALLNPQVMTVTRSVNGITKSHSAGADIRLADPTHIAL